jgi:hypothetical protein
MDVPEKARPPKNKSEVERAAKNLSMQMTSEFLSLTLADERDSLSGKLRYFL